MSALDERNDIDTSMQDLSLHGITLRDLAVAAVAALWVPSGDDVHSGEAHYLSATRQLIPLGTGSWSELLTHWLKQAPSNDAPVLRIAHDLGLTWVELLTIALAAAVEDELMLGRALARLQAPVGGSRPTLGLLSTAFAPLTTSERAVLDALMTGEALRSGIIVLSNENLPVPERAVSVSHALCLALRGLDGLWPGVTIGLGQQSPVPLPHSIALEIRAQSRALSAGSGRTLVIRCRSGNEGRSVAAALAAVLRLRPAFIETDKISGMGSWLKLRGLLPVFCVELHPGERKTVPVLPGYEGPRIVLTGTDGSIDTGSGALQWTIPVPDAPERLILWQQAIGDLPLAAELAHQHRHGSGRIAQLGRLARHHGALHGRDRPVLEDIVAAAWQHEGVSFDALAQPIAHPTSPDALVLTAAMRDEMTTLLQRVRARDQLTAHLGVTAATRYHAGVRVLFVGPSGTGKTLAASWLAAQLGLPLYRVDLASVTSKYIGETEKNLAQLLARAEQAEIVLLFDEADSIFGQRTDVRDSNDRFANAQTNFLLQRIESFEGIALLTSNSRARFDHAFTRRLDSIIEFPLPGAEERRALWLAHLGNGHNLQNAQINQLSAVCDLAGGYIRNAVLTAAAAANSRHSPIHFSDVVAGLAAEYRKLGTQLPGELREVANRTSKSG